MFPTWQGLSWKPEADKPAKGLPSQRRPFSLQPFFLNPAYLALGHAELLGDTPARHDRVNACILQGDQCGAQSAAGARHRAWS
jgi:hypothetical protein